MPTYLEDGPANMTQLVGRISADHLKEGHACLIFSSKDSAQACREFLVSEKRKEAKGEDGEVEIRVFEGPVRIWVTSFPAIRMPAAIPYWQDCGTGVSSRLAQDFLEHYDSVKEVKLDAALRDGLGSESQAYDTIKRRITGYLTTSTISEWPKKVTSDDVFLYPTGMSAIYQLHRYLQQSSTHPGSTVLFGFAFHSTPHVYKEYSEHFKWFGKGDGEELKQLEEFCTREASAGRQVQAVWLEFPTNPNLRCANLTRLRALADKFGFILVVDDTIASFCNVDLLGIADVLITSLTKSFSGYSDVMGGSVVLNPNSKFHKQLKELFGRSFINEYYQNDVEAMERNSRDYIERSKRLNANAFAVVEYLQSLVSDTTSSIAGVTYPAVGPGDEHYKAVMRPASPEFEPGYGCLFSVELDSIETTVAFYDNLHVHNGPHLGAHLTLALPYVKAIHAKEIPWLEECGMNEKMIRVSIGLEETGDLVQVFRTAVQAADRVKHKDPLDKIVNPVN